MGRYYMLVNSKFWTQDLKILCTEILSSTIKEEDKYQVGLTKIFFRAGMLAYLENRRMERLNHLVTVMQKNFLRHCYQKRYKNFRFMLIGVQCQGRKILAKKEMETMKREQGAIKIQRFVRGSLVRKRVGVIKKNMINIQSLARGWIVRRTFKEKKKNEAAVRLQSLFRGL
jgi:myosin V